jgi:hypothetical protein
MIHCIDVHFLIYYIVQIFFEINEMGRACSAYGGEERSIQGFGGET